MISSLPHAPATHRNRDPILSVLDQLLPSKGRVLELASGTGEHITYFSKQYSSLTWQPSDKASSLFWAIKQRGSDCTNQKDPVLIDVSLKEWHSGNWGLWDVILCINMVHISPWEASEGLFQGAAQHLSPQGKLYLYGPYRFEGKHTSNSNIIFDRSLRARNELWGIRDAEALEELGEKSGLRLQQKIAMPANNFSLVFGR